MKCFESPALGLNPGPSVDLRNPDKLPQNTWKDTRVPFKGCTLGTAPLYTICNMIIYIYIYIYYIYIYVYIYIEPSV